MIPHNTLSSSAWRERKKQFREWSLFRSLLLNTLLQVTRKYISRYGIKISSKQIIGRKFLIKTRFLTFSMLFAQRTRSCKHKKQKKSNSIYNVSKPSRGCSHDLELQDKVLYVEWIPCWLFEKFQNISQRFLIKIHSSRYFSEETFNWFSKIYPGKLSEYK